MSLPSIWPALVSGQRSTEVMAWARKNREVCATLKGAQGESMLHWAGLCDQALLLELASYPGFNLNDQDAHGRTPLDWAWERLWMVHHEGLGQLTAHGKKKLRWQSDELIATMEGLLGHPDTSRWSWFAGQIGLWKTLKVWGGLLGGNKAWTEWSSDRGNGQTLLHALVWAPSEKGRQDVLDLWVQDLGEVDVENERGETPLMTAVMHRLERGLKPSYELDGYIKWLVMQGASPHHVDQEGFSALDRIGVSSVDPSLRRWLEGEILADGRASMA